MKTYSLSHLADGVLLRDLNALVARDRATTAAMLAHLAEVEARRLYARAAHPSMHSYCVHVLRMSEDCAFRRITAARAAREFPLILEAVADGRLHLTGVLMLAPRLTQANTRDLVAEAAHKTKADIEMLLARRFPREDAPTLVQAVESTSNTETQLAPARVEVTADPPERQVDPRPRIAPLSPERFVVQVTVDRSTHDKLRRAQDLLSHQLRSGDIATVLDKALDALIRELEKRKFAATDKPRPGSRRTSGSRARHIPAAVRRAVRARDGDQCTFVGEHGERCPARKLLEFDHIDPVARGGEATVDRVRLRCRAHNQYTAECVFGTEFMENKRRQARESAEARAKATSSASPSQTTSAATARTSQTRTERPDERVEAEQNVAGDPDHDVIPWLRRLGFRPEEARRAARDCKAPPGASIEERVRLALTYLRPNARHVPAPVDREGECATTSAA